MSIPCWLSVLLFFTYRIYQSNGESALPIKNSRCTAIAVGKKATADHGTFNTMTNDCANCDLRISHVSAYDWPEGSMRPIVVMNNGDGEYPRYLEAANENIHGPDFLKENTDYTIFPWKNRKPYYAIPQVAHTYAYTLGTYAIQNEKQVAISESTCGAVFYSKPIFGGGHAIFQMATLTEVALERCATARCAVKLIGELTFKYGFFGSGWKATGRAAQSEAGEALIISDPNDVWVFHVLSDDTGKSSIWAAQRIPDDHIVAVANGFVLQDVKRYDEDEDDENSDFLYSPNLFDVAIRHNLWNPEEERFNFYKIYGFDLGKEGYLISRRIWRIFTYAAPSLHKTFSPYTDSRYTFGFGKNGNDPYPVSVRVEGKLHVQDLMYLNRDKFEGSEFDLTKGVQAGPFGDPMRWEGATLEDEIPGSPTQAQIDKGFQAERPISLWLTSYSIVAQCRSSLPDVVGAKTWIVTGAPHGGSFIPIYASGVVPKELKIGTLYKFEKHSLFWVFSLVSNYLARWYKFTVKDLVEHQVRIESILIDRTAEFEAKARSMVERVIEANEDQSRIVRLKRLAQTIEKIANLASLFHAKTASEMLDEWWDFFWTMVSKYRDVHMMTTKEKAPSYKEAVSHITYSRDWAEIIGMWGPPGTPPLDESEPLPSKLYTAPTLQSKKEYNEKYPKGIIPDFHRPTVFVSKESIKRGKEQYDDNGIMATLLPVKSELERDESIRQFNKHSKKVKVDSFLDHFEPTRPEKNQFSEEDLNNLLQAKTPDYLLINPNRESMDGTPISVISADQLLENSDLSQEMLVSLSFASLFFGIVTGIIATFLLMRKSILHHRGQFLTAEI